MQNNSAEKIRTRIFFPAVVGLILLVFFFTARSNDASSDQPRRVPPLPIGSRGTWDLVFHDEFDGDSLDPNKWVTCYWWDNDGCSNEGNNELQWYQPENVIVRDGSLHLVAQRETVTGSNGREYNYTSGMVTTGRDISDVRQPVRFAFEYGFAEIRVRLPKGKGLWPAFWLLPTRHESKPEIDVFEFLGDQPDRVFLYYHYRDENGEARVSRGNWIEEDFTEDWHTFGVEWNRNQISWFVDGTERRRYTTTEYISHESMYLLLNLAVGGDWPGSPDENTPFPSTYEIDYVRVWKAGGDARLHPVADTYLDATEPDTNFGRETVIRIDGNPHRIGLMKFDLSNLSGARLRSAALRIRTTRETGSGSVNGQTFHLVEENDWDEESVVYADNLTIDPEWLGKLDQIEPNVIYEIPFDVEKIQDRVGGILSIAIENHGDDGLNIYAREFQTVYAELILRFEQQNTFGFQRE